MQFFLHRLLPPYAKQCQIREQDPLKQGLKPIKVEGIKELQIREQDPLKQGLKLNRVIVI
jgi:hypothetical protein